MWVLLRPRSLRLPSVANQFDRTCIGAVPIIVMMSFLIGAIISQQGGFYLRQFGAEVYVVDLAGVLVLRELGVILTAIMVAGRSGSAFTAEIGSMKMREEIDALHVIGLRVTEVLILPRLLARRVLLDPPRERRVGREGAVVLDAHRAPRAPGEHLPEVDARRRFQLREEARVRCGGRSHVVNVEHRLRRLR